MSELLCPERLALALGCEVPRTMLEHRARRASGRHLLVRDPATLLPMFWPLIPPLQSIETSS